MRCAVLGSPIAHSLSPALHRAAYDTSTSTGPTRRSRSIRRARAVHRRAGRELARVVAHDAAQADRRTPRRLARLLGAPGRRQHGGAGPDNVAWASTPTSRGDGRHARAAAGPGPVRGGPRRRSHGDVGAARTRRAGVYDGPAARARARARRGDRGGCRGASPRARDLGVLTISGAAAVEADIVVSTVPAAAQTPELLAACAAASAVFEVVYDPWPTPLARSALDSGRALVSGLDLLAHQAILQVELMTGQSVPVELLREAGRGELARRAVRNSVEER